MFTRKGKECAHMQLQVIVVLLIGSSTNIIVIDLRLMTFRLCLLVKVQTKQNLQGRAQFRHSYSED